MHNLTGETFLTKGGNPESKKGKRDIFIQINV